jgi:hypothetical protein
VADSGGNQRIDLARPPPVPVVSRPLKTGPQFTLVLPQPRFILKAWDKAIYDPGDEAQLLLKGKNLGDGPYEFIVELDDGSGSWSEVERVSAQVSGGTEAKGTFKIPAPKKLTGGHFTKAEWGKTECKSGETLPMTIEAEGLEGEWILVVVEREETPGEWAPETRWDGHIKDGKFETSWQTPADEETGEEPHKLGLVTDVKWADEEHKAGETAWLLAKTQNMDGETLHFTLERQLGPGVWEEVGQAVSTIKSNEAKAGIEIPKPGLKQVGTLQTAQFAGEVTPGEDATLEVTAVNMDGQQVTFFLEHQDEKTGQWVQDLEGTAQIASGKASATLKAAPLPDLTPPELLKEQVVSAKFGGELEIGGKVSLDVTTMGMDGQTVTLILEVAEGGEWVPVEETVAVVKGDAASATVTVPQPVRLMAQSLSVQFEKQKYVEGEEINLLLDAEGLDGELAELGIEEEQPDGTFREIAKDRALLKQGQVKVKLVPPPWQGGAGTGPPGSAGAKKTA